MSGNAHQRKLARDNRELLELGRRQRSDLDSRATELAALQSRHEAELATMRATHKAELADAQQRYTSEIDSWARVARADADATAALRSQLATEKATVQQLQAQLADFQREGVVTHREHEARVVQETAKIRERLRRATAERLAPKRLVLEHIARGDVPAGGES